MFLKACEDLLGTGATTKIALDYSIGNSIFCDFLEDRVIDEAFARSIQKRMEELAKANLPITKRSLDTDQAAKYFDRIGEERIISVSQGIKDEYLLVGWI